MNRSTTPKVQVRAVKGCSPVWDIPGHQGCLVAPAGSQMWEKLDSLLRFLMVADAMLPSRGSTVKLQRITRT